MGRTEPFGSATDGGSDMQVHGGDRPRVGKKRKDVNSGRSSVMAPHASAGDVSKRNVGDVESKSLRDSSWFFVALVVFSE